MTTEEIVKKLEPWLARHRRPAWKPVVEDGDGPATASKFCGTPWIGSDAHFALKRLARRYGVTKQEMIERLAIAEHERIQAGIELDSPEWNTYFGVTR